MSTRFDGKVVIVTGAGSGIGRATAIQLAMEGAIVVVVNRSVANGEETLHLIREVGGEAIFIQADVSKSEDVQNYINQTIEKYGKIDALFNNAGTEGARLPLADYPEDVFENVFATNVKGMFLGMKYAIPHLIENGGGAILNTSSITGFVGGANSSAYSASKHAIIGLAKSATAEYAKDGIRFNVICPGPTATNMVNRIAATMSKEEIEYMSQNPGAGIPSGRITTVEEVAHLACFLLSDESKSINGAVHTIDGGMTAAY